MTEQEEEAPPVANETTPLVGAGKAIENVKTEAAKHFEGIKTEAAKHFETISTHTAKGLTGIKSSTTQSIDNVKGISVKGYQNVEKATRAIFSEENMTRATDFTKGATDELRQQATEGDFSIRMFAMLAGIFLVVDALCGFFGLLFSFHITECVLEVYTLALGSIMLGLEGRSFLRQCVTDEQKVVVMDHVYNTVFKYAAFLKFVWGRGGLYFVAGSLQATQGTVRDYCIGGFCLCVGLLYILVGRQTAQNLAKLRQSLSSQTIKEKFDEADVDGTGALSQEQFRALTTQLGLELNRRESELAFLHMDESDKGKITLEEFERWWNEWEEAKDIV